MEIGVMNRYGIKIDGFNKIDFAVPCITVFFQIGKN